MLEADPVKNAQEYLTRLSERDKVERALEGLITQNFTLQMENIGLQKTSTEDGLQPQGSGEVNESVQQKI